jgi:hypothetical protein
VAVGTNAPTYTYTAVESQAGQILNVVCTVTATYGTASSNTALATVQVWVSFSLLAQPVSVSTYAAPLGSSTLCT